MNKMTKPDSELIDALSACVAHARDLLEAAKTVQSTGRSNIAYHLATLALEEMGKRELYGIQAAATAVGEPPKWQIRATDDHKTKLFWCFYGFGQIPDIVDQRQFFEMRATAADIHANRIAGRGYKPTKLKHVFKIDKRGNFGGPVVDDQQLEMGLIGG
jgi:AbiV family abortive infection protein